MVAVTDFSRISSRWFTSGFEAGGEGVVGVGVKMPIGLLGTGERIAVATVRCVVQPASVPALTVMGCRLVVIGVGLLDLFSL